MGRRHAAGSLSKPFDVEGVREVLTRCLPSPTP
jgi:hypothetical protein